MRRIHLRLRLKIFPLLLGIIILVAVYILLRFATISFSEDMGQAGLHEALISKLCLKVFESGSSFIAYAATDKGVYTFPINMVDNKLPLNEYTEDGISNGTATKEAFLQYDRYEYQVKDNADITPEATSAFKGLKIYKVESDLISQEYVMTNGAVLQSSVDGILLGDDKVVNNQLPVDYLQGEVSQEGDNEENNEEDKSATETLSTTKEVSTTYTMEQLEDVDFLVRNFYIVDATTKVTDSLFDAKKLLGKDMTIKQGNDAPQILIYHTHSQEAFIDSRPGKEEDTVVGVGTYLTKILEDDYGYNVIHDTTKYDILGGRVDRNLAYTYALDGVTKILEDNPSIEVIIDLHRNSGEGKTVNIDGRETALVMLFNGLSRDQKGPLPKLENPNLQDNLAMSLQLQLKSKELYPGLFKKNYLKFLRYNMHLRKKSILMELGTENNTVESEKNAMIPFAEILDDVLKGK